VLDPWDVWPSASAADASSIPTTRATPAVQAQNAAEHDNCNLCEGRSHLLVNVVEIFGSYVVIDLHWACARPVAIYTVPCYVRDPVLIASLGVHEIPDGAVQPLQSFAAIVDRAAGLGEADPPDPCGAIVAEARLQLNVHHPVVVGHIGSLVSGGAF